MKAKHERLETNVLILASRSGFTPEARDVAKQFGIETFTLEDVEKADYPALFGESGSLWMKTFTVLAERVTVNVGVAGETPAEKVVANPDNFIHASDSSFRIRPLCRPARRSELSISCPKPPMRLLSSMK
jgi:hypothetical protein